MAGQPRDQVGAASGRRPGVRPGLRTEGAPSVWLWVLRAAWIALPFAVGPAVNALISGRSRSVEVTGTALAWILWGIGLLAVAVPLPIGLVALRLVAPVIAALPIVAAIDRRTGHATSTVQSAIGLALALAVFVMVLHPETGSVCVNGPAYPNERRFLLRPPAVVQLALVPVTAALTGAAAVTGPLLLAARQWVAGVVVTALAAGSIVIVGRAMRALVRRFVVFVPAGFVVHDELALQEPVLFPKSKVEGLRAAPADSDSLDLTKGASGLAVETLLTEKADVVLTDRSNREGRPGRTGRFLFTPTRPGRVLAEASAARLAAPHDS